MRKTVKAAKRHAKTNAAVQVRAEFMTAMLAVMGRSLRLHAAGKMDDEYLLGIVESSQRSFEIAQRCSYNVRMPGKALTDWGGEELRDYRNREVYGQPVNDSARRIIEAGDRGYFDKLIGEDNPYFEPPVKPEPPAAPGTTRPAKQPSKAQRKRKAGSRG